MMRLNKTYSELSSLSTFEERFDYLKIGGKVGDETFGYERYLNQVLYRSDLWKTTRRDIIIRDNGYEMGLIDDRYEIKGPIYVHHINPITIEMIINTDPLLFDPENLISVSKKLHDAIHYATDNQVLYSVWQERKPYDTCPWRK